MTDPDTTASTDASDRRAVRATYDRIADHFAETRAHPWPEVPAFLDGRGGATGLDLGAGNGRHVEPLAERTDRVLAVDASGDLLRIGRDRASDRGYSDRYRPVTADAARLPLAADTVDLGVYVATLHHLPDRPTRVASLSELARVLAPGGRALVSAWSTAHDRFDRPADAERGFDTTVDWTLPGGETVPRFYHVYAPAEFDADLAASDLAAVDSFVSSGNCYAVVRTPAENDR
ncbi:SAM-dependent methyltransferase [Haloglomus irregulare]|uniref:SAM-dependent methyltransferase n=1 Tax=Haloglomus irregulare TaxID=2234134 RepID=A0A554MWH5_9EURY|nr:class I SAM-dependent methyltransferase [Haloglomus irregulare]TSD09478.1 SAM-dependent methyltransferase [Haloglomus irregulare]